MNAIIYCRVATKKQATQDYSLTKQEKDCRGLAKKNGHLVTKVFSDNGKNGNTLDRSELQKLIGYIFLNERKPPVLIVRDYARLSRNLADLTTLLKRFDSLGVEVLSATENVDDSPAGKLTKNMIATIAQFGNDIRSERIKAGLRKRKNNLT